MSDPCLLCRVVGHGLKVTAQPSPGEGVALERGRPTETAALRPAPAHPVSVSVTGCWAVPEFQARFRSKSPPWRPGGGPWETVNLRDRRFQEQPDWTAPRRDQEHRFRPPPWAGVAAVMKWVRQKGRRAAEFPQELILIPGFRRKRSLRLSLLLSRLSCEFVLSSD